LSTPNFFCLKFAVRGKIAAFCPYILTHDATACPASQRRVKIQSSASQCPFISDQSAGDQ